MNDLYFSRAKLDFQDGGADRGRGVTRSYLVHQAVSDLFGQYQIRPYLYRSDARDHNAETVLILSANSPWNDLADRPRRWPSVVSLETTIFPQQFAVGTRLDFEVRLNATRDIPNKGGGRSSRIDAWEAVWRANRRTDLDQHTVYGDYFRRRLEGLAEVENARVTERGEVTVRRSLTEKTPIRFVAVNLIGTLTVADSAGFISRVAEGIGRSRSLGYGLVCLSRPGTVLVRRHVAHAQRASS